MIVRVLGEGQFHVDDDTAAKLTVLDKDLDAAVHADDEPAYAPIRHVYGIPFGALVPAGRANVLLASPAISAALRSI